MPSANPAPPSRRRILPAVILALVLMFAVVGPVIRDRATSAAQPTDTQVTEPPAPTNPPPPTVPAPPTQIPPTNPPPPTEPPPPTVVPPTDVPATEQPTVVPTNTPDAFPSTPSVPPTNPPSQQQPQGPSRPVDAGEVQIECTPGAGQATPVANAESWNLQTCAIPGSFAGADSLDIQATSSDPGWRAILLDPADVSTPGMLNASNSRTVIDDVEGSGGFLMGVQRTCSALGGTTLTFALTGISGTEPITATGTLALKAPGLADVQVDLLAASVDTSGDIASGAFTVAWQRSDSPVCPWQVTLILPGASGIAQENLTGPNGIAAVEASGTVVITIPANAPSGEFRLEVTFPEGLPTAAGVKAQVRP